MDAPDSPGVDADNEVFFLQINDASFPDSKRTVIKYTKLPDFDFDSKVSWPRRNSYTLQPRLRRIIELDDTLVQTSRSLKPTVAGTSKNYFNNYTKRKIVTISEKEEDYHDNRGWTANTTNKATTTTVLKEDRQESQRSTSRLTNPPKCWTANTTNKATTTTVLKEDRQASQTSTSRLTNPPKCWTANTTNKATTTTVLKEDRQASQTSTSRLTNPPKWWTANTTNKATTTTVLKEDRQASQRSTSRLTNPPKCWTANTTNKATTTTVLKEDRQASQTSTSRLTNPPKYSRESKPSAKTNNVTNRRDTSVNKLNLYANKTNLNTSQDNNLRNRSTKDREQFKKLKSTPTAPKLNLSKNKDNPSKSEKDISQISKKLVDILRHLTLPKQTEERVRFAQPLPRTPKQAEEKIRFAPSPSQSKINVALLKEIKSKCKPVTVIHVPLDSSAKYERIISLKKTKSENTVSGSDHTSNETDSNEYIVTQVDDGTDSDTLINPKDAEVETNPPPTMVTQATGTSHSQINDYCYHHDSSIQTEVTADIYDNLDVPNISLTNVKNNFSKEEIVNFSSHSLPSLQASSFKINPEKEDIGSYSNFSNKSYIIGQATLTYTTKQKINFHVVGSSDDSLSPSPLAYPVNVLSVFKKELNSRVTSESSEENNLTKNKERLVRRNCNLNLLQDLNHSYVLNNSALVKPSDLISALKVNSGLMPNDYICEQFQRELNFIDSFFESLQYLETCSFSEKCFTNEKCENWVSTTGVDLKNSDYNSFLSKLENGANTFAHVDDIETMASKSLCLLNLLIRDEQRRAKNLLFVLKMREDALKDFTKSQIIWLENKKKQDNTDVSTLKKKQRGALLKLQHECGEMHRMRKALLTLSEKRKAALMKTRSNIELKLKNNVELDQILLGKKKLKRNTGADRNTAPLKCFELSSSGCDESTSSKHKSETNFQEIPPSISSAEKSIQTGDSIFECAGLVDQATDAADENFVSVDGSYLNILFQSLLLPQIFSRGKQYEVNENALNNIVNSSNRTYRKDHYDSDIVEQFTDNVKYQESESSSSPSTAHSLVDEFDQYYKGLGDGSKSSVDSTDTECQKVSPAYEIEEVRETDKLEQSEQNVPSTKMSISTETLSTQPDPLFCSQLCSCDPRNKATDIQPQKARETCTSREQAGPLPVPPGAAASPEPVAADGPGSAAPLPESSASCGTSPDTSAPPAPDPGEAEELRRQQLAIEREIKALEQQQCQLLVVREIPDKPPPPYTPPNNQTQKLPRRFLLNESLEQRIQRSITEEEDLDIDHSVSIDVFAQDILQESLSRQMLCLSDEPWDACNLLPHTRDLTPEKIAQEAISHINNVLSGVSPVVVSGVSGRRSDHIDDILFAEWRRCEPDWTALYSDEAIVKNQAFESIFQKVLSETIEQYKRTVLGSGTIAGSSMH